MNLSVKDVTENVMQISVFFRLDGDTVVMWYLVDTFIQKTDCVCDPLGAALG